MASPARTRLDLDQRRRQLVEIGLELFSERAYDEIAIDDIAAQAGISKGLLYHYFPSKRDFYVAIIGEAGRELRERTEPDPSLDPLQRLNASIDAYLAHVEQYPRGHATLLRGGIGSDPEVRAIVDEHRRVNAQRILDAIAEQGGELTPAVRLAVRGWIGFVEAVSLEWVEKREVPRDEVRALCVQTLGWAVSAAAGPPGFPA
ncbi:MAG TPA: TetR/AcrR family transcriptional regulator [Solirubrobacteraceae bacterium]|nr:TetR/AcrR family transcriptional regulator [Solirubrobacteraceae bacterium]